MFPHVTRAQFPSHSVQFCSSSKSMRAPPTKEGAHSVACRLGFPPLPVLFTSSFSRTCPESLAAGEEWGLVCLRSREGEPCEIALGLGLL